MNATALAEQIHNLRHQLNVIGLSASNLEARLQPHVDPDLAQYVQAKISKIDAGVAQATKIIDEIAYLYK